MPLLSSMCVKSRAAVLAFCLALLCCGAAPAEGAGPKIESIRLQNTADRELDLCEGSGELDLVYTVTPEDAAETELTWTTSRPGIVEVMQGEAPRTVHIRPLAAGETRIVGTAKDGSGAKLEFRATVKSGIGLRFRGGSRVHYSMGYYLFYLRCQNVSGTRTVDAVTVQYIADDRDGIPMKAYGFDPEPQRVVLRTYLKPGQASELPGFCAHGYSYYDRIGIMHLALCEVHYTDGTTAATEEPDYWDWNLSRYPSL